MPPSPVRRRVPLLIGLLLALLALSGCARVQAALAVQPDDTVQGEVVVATPEQSPEDPGPPITIPPDLRSEVEIDEYRQGGYVGSLVRFEGLTFPQFSELVSAAANATVRLELRRTGNRVTTGGEIDLTTAAVDGADFQLKISFPGQVLDANGDVDSGTVGWVFDVGRVGDVEAVVAFDDPAAPSPLNWTLGLTAVVAMVAVAVVMLARRARNPPVEPTIR